MQPTSPSNIFNAEISLPIQKKSSKKTRRPFERWKQEYSDEVIQLFKLYAGFKPDWQWITLQLNTKHAINFTQKKVTDHWNKKLKYVVKKQIEQDQQKSQKTVLNISQNVTSFSANVHELSKMPTLENFENEAYPLKIHNGNSLNLGTVSIKKEENPKIRKPRLFWTIEMKQVLIQKYNFETSDSNVLAQELSKIFGKTITHQQVSNQIQKLVSTANNILTDAEINLLINSYVY